MEPHRKEPVAMDSMTQVEGPIHLGLDVAKNAIVVGILEPGGETPAVDRIFHEEASVRRLVDRFDDRSRPTRRPSPGPGRGSSGCAAGSGGWPPVGPTKRLWSPRSPGSWPGSCGPR